MNSKKIPLSFLRALLRLSFGEQLKASEITSRSILKKFLDDGIIKERAISKQRRVYVCVNSENLKHYLNTQYDILSLDKYIQQKEGEGTDGENSLQASKSTKTFREGSLQGFFMKAVGTSIILDQQEIPSIPSGVELFIHQPNKLVISPETVVVGIENPECFLKFEVLRKLFPQQELLLVMRYMSLSPNKWLETIPNPYLHFGDFDPAGVSIYINEYRNKLGAERCLFFIPDNLERMLKEFGSSDLYDAQFHQIKNVIPTDYTEIQSLIMLLNKYQKGLEQERLLSI